MARMSKAVDGTRPIGLNVRQCHWNKAKPRNENYCAIAVAGRDTFDDCRMLRNFVYFLMNGVWRRYYAGAPARLMAALLDKGNKRNLKLPEGGVRIMFDPPKGVRSQAYLRSAHRKRIVAASRLRSKAKKSGRVYRRTDSVSLQDIRHGAGLYV